MSVSKTDANLAVSISKNNPSFDFVKVLLKYILLINSTSIDFTFSVMVLLLNDSYWRLTKSPLTAPKKIKERATKETDINCILKARVQVDLPFLINI